MQDGGQVESGGFPTATSRKGMVPIKTVVSGGDTGNETKKPITINEAISAFAERKHRIKIYKVSRILFDPKQLPGVTPEEGLDFLLKGLKIEDSEADELRRTLAPNSEIGQKVRENFPEFIEYMTQQNEGRTIAEIWDAADADPFTKIALQWEIQDPRKRYADEEYLKELAVSTASDLRRLDLFLKKIKGNEVLLQFAPEGIDDFKALTTANEEGLGFIQQKDPNNPYREVFLSGLVVSTDRVGGEKIIVTPHLRIPFELRGMLHSETPENWGKYIYDFSRSGKYRCPFDPDNPFPGIMTGRELAEQIELDSGLRPLYSKFKKATKQPSRDLKTRALPQ